MRGLRIVLPLILIAIGSAPGSTTSVDESTDVDTTSQLVQDVKSVLSAQVKAWNSGDVPGFMEGYIQSNELRFASGGSVTQGWQATLDRYLKRYTDRTIMGSLEFKNLKVLPLSSTYAEVFGSWHLTRDAETGDASGLFTLLMKKTDSGWRVLHDHTSSAEKK